MVKDVREELYPVHLRPEGHLAVDQLLSQVVVLLLQTKDGVPKLLIFFLRCVCVCVYVCACVRVCVCTYVCDMDGFIQDYILVSASFKNPLYNTVAREITYFL